MPRTMSIVATAVLAFALAGCGHKANEQMASAGNDISNGTEATGNAMSDAASGVKEALSPVPTGQEFVDKAAKSDAFEIASAKLAREKSGSPDIKRFAAMMIDDHTASTARIMAAASAASPAIAPDPTLADDQKAKLADLGKLAGADFDKEYVSQQVKAHEKALSLMTLYSDKGEVASLKAVAGEIAPKVQQHLDGIKAIQDTLKG